MAAKQTASPGPKAEEGLSFEQAMERLETIVRELESGELTLDESLARYEEGTRLSQRLSRALDAAEGHTVGLFVREEDSNHACAFVPGCGDLPPPLLERLAEADALLFDGTFWQDSEPVALGISTRTARQMDHLPIGGADGSLERLARLPCRHRVYTHINNTNPVLLEQSPERAAVAAAGLLVGYDGLYITL